MGLEKHMRRASAPIIKVNGYVEDLNSLRYIGSAALLRISFQEELEKTRTPKESSFSGSAESCDKNESRRSPSPCFLNVPNLITHQYTEDPTLAWEMLRPKRTVKLVRQMKLDTPIRSDHVRFVCIACLHGELLDPQYIPPGDVLIVAGDVTECGLPTEIQAFSDNMAMLKHTFKIVIAGSSDCSFDENFVKLSGKDIINEKQYAIKQAVTGALSQAKISNPKALLNDIIYLQDSLVELFGIRIYGTPWQPKYDNLAFNLDRGQALLDKWNQIPTCVDVLVTHTPPLGYGDLLSDGSRVGCVELLNSIVRRIRPKYHVFGHVHEGYGCTTDGYTKFVNCSLKSNNPDGFNLPIIFDISVPPEMKTQFLKNSKKLMRKQSKK